MTFSDYDDLIKKSEKLAELWRLQAEISRHQASVANNWRRVMGWPGTLSNSQLAPNWLHQVINPVNFSIFGFLNETRGDARLEEEIVTEVAGYGSQLGTLIDAVMTLLPRDGKPTAEESEDITYARVRLKRLAEEIKRRKGSDSVRSCNIATSSFSPPSLSNQK